MIGRSMEPLRTGPPPAMPMVECDVPGPLGEPGCLLRSQRHEKLDWDVENEIGSTRREWVEEQGGWWVAPSYLETLIELVLRSFPKLVVRDAEGRDRLLSRSEKSPRRVWLL